MKKTLLVAALAALALPGVSNASIIVSVGSPSNGLTVAPGSTIQAVVSGYTDNSNGVNTIQTRIQESINGGTSAQASPFSAAVVATNANNTASNQPDVSSFLAPYAAEGSTLTLEPPTAKFAHTANGFQPNQVAGNEPLTAIVASSSSNGPVFGQFYSPTATLQPYADISFAIPANVPVGTVITFNLTSSGNGLGGVEYTDNSGDISDVTEGISGSGFSVTVGSPIPEPASLGLLAAGFGGLMLRRRK